MTKKLNCYTYKLIFEIKIFMSFYTFWVTFNHLIHVMCSTHFVANKMYPFDPLERPIVTQINPFMHKWVDIVTSSLYHSLSAFRKSIFVALMLKLMTERHGGIHWSFEDHSGKRLKSRSSWHANKWSLCCSHIRTSGQFLYLYYPPYTPTHHKQNGWSKTLIIMLSFCSLYAFLALVMTLEGPNVGTK